MIIKPMILVSVRFSGRAFELIIWSCIRESGWSGEDKMDVKDKFIPH